MHDTCLLVREVVCRADDDAVCLAHASLFQAGRVVGIAWQEVEAYALQLPLRHALRKAASPVCQHSGICLCLSQIEPETPADACRGPQTDADWNMLVCVDIKQQALAIIVQPILMGCTCQNANKKVLSSTAMHFPSTYAQDVRMQHMPLMPPTQLEMPDLTAAAAAHARQLLLCIPHLRRAFTDDCDIGPRRRKGGHAIHEIIHRSTPASNHYVAGGHIRHFTAAPVVVIVAPPALMLSLLWVLVMQLLEPVQRLLVG